MKIALSERAAGIAALLGGLLVAAGAWLFVPRERSGGSAPRAPVRVCLVDVSASAVFRRTQWRAFVEKEIDAQRAAARSAGEDLEIVLYGSEVRRVDGPLVAAGGRVEIERETRLAGAVEVAQGLALDPSRRAGRVIAIGDRTYTGEDPAPRIRALAAAGVPFDWIDLPAPDREELAFGPLALPAELEPGAPIALEADVFYAPVGTPRAQVSTKLTLESFGRRDERTLEIAVPPGLVPDADGYLRWRLRETAGVAAAGLNAVRLQGGRGFSRADADGEASSEGVVRCAGRLAVAAVSSDPRLVAGRIAGQRPPGILPVTAREGFSLETIWPDEIASRLPVLDALVTEGPAPLPIPVLRSFVERGGGWLALAFPPFAKAGDAEKDLFPLIPPEREPRDVVVLVDRSGSMAGDAFESVRRAVLRLVEAAPEQDAVELRFFGERLSEPVLLKAAGDSRERDRILHEASERFFGAGEPGGRTAIARALESFAAARESAGRESLVFLLSDGKDTVDSDAAPRCAHVLPRLRAARTRLVVIAAGDEPGAELLKGLVAEDETLRSVGPLASSSSDLASIFERELSKDAFREGVRLRVLPAASSPGSIAADVLGAGTLADPATRPSLTKYARAKLAPGAEAIWTSERGEPLLAVHRVGLGLVAACAFEPGPEWSELLVPLIRALARGMKGAGPRARIEDGVLAVEGLPDDAPAELEARVYGPDSDRPALVVALSPPLEGGDPRRMRTASATALDLGGRSARVEIRARGTGGAWPAIELAVAAPRSPEFVLPRPRVDPDALRTPSVAPATRSATGPSPHPAAPWVLFSGLCLLTLSGLAGVFSRRSRGRAHSAPGGQAIAVLGRRDTP